MSLSAAQITQVYEIFAVPQNGSGAIVSAIATPFGPVMDVCDATAIVTQIDAKLAALTDTQITRVSTLLTRWDLITSTSPLSVSPTNAKHGTAADHPAERAAIRTALSNLVGVAVPSGGFVAEVMRVNQTSIVR